MIKEGTIVKGTNNCNDWSGMVVRSKTHNRDEVEATVCEVILQTGTNERAIYVYVNDEFHLIKDTVSGIAPSNLEIA